jgi:hypothetical protein
MTDELRAVGERFAIAGRFAGAVALGRGHIHETFVASWESGGDRVRYVHQRFSTRVFPNPALVMENIVRVTAHLRAALARRGVGDLERRVLTLVPARDGRPFFVAPEGSVWRTFLLVEGTVTREIVAGPAEAFEAARAFADFSGLLSDLPAPPLAITLAGFHDLTAFRRFRSRRRARCLGRAAGVRAEIEATRSAYADVSRMLAAARPDQAPAA